MKETESSIPSLEVIAPAKKMGPEIMTFEKEIELSISVSEAVTPEVEVLGQVDNVVLTVESVVPILEEITVLY